jgi:RNA polymerase sigma-70 factor (ECF subfamily)
LEEAKLAERARSGDTAAYERLVRMHQAVAFRAAYLVTGDGPDAEDAIQEAFIKAYRALDRFRPGAPFRPWLLAIVTNEARNRRRSAGRRAKLSLQVSAEGQVLSTAASPEAAVVAAERREELLASVGELSEGERLVISYRYFLGLSEEETATTLGCARGTVKSRASRAIVRLRKAMAREEDA